MIEKQVLLLPAREQVASILREAIINGEYKEGEAITLEQISQMYGVSKMPVREAFQILERDGLISLYPNKGARVIAVGYEAIINRYETRAALETEAIRLLCDKNLAIEDYKTIDCINEKFQNSINVDFRRYPVAVYNWDFHNEIWNLSSNKYLQKLLEQVTTGVALRDERFTISSEQDVLNIHLSIIDACKRHEKEKAMDIMYRHIIESGKSRVKVIQKLKGDMS